MATDTILAKFKCATEFQNQIPCVLRQGPHFSEGLGANLTFLAQVVSSLGPFELFL